MNRVFCRPALLTASVLLAFPMALQAQNTAPNTDTPASPGNSDTATPHSDATSFTASDAADCTGSAALAKAGGDFMRTAADAALYGMDVSRLVTERAASVAVKMFAEKWSVTTVLPTKG